MDRRRLKICGLTTVDDVSLCVRQKIGYIGFIAAPHSKRAVTPHQVRQLSALVKDSQTVLVTQNQSIEDIAPYFEGSNISAIQLHGDETDEECAAFKRHFKLPIIKAIAIKTQQDVALTTAYQHIDMLLFDTKRADGLSGGAGETFNWNILRHATITKPWFLSGGIDADNLARAVEEVSPPYLDLSSSVEAYAGKKDHDKITHLLERLDTV